MSKPKCQINDKVQISSDGREFNLSISSMQMEQDWSKSLFIQDSIRFPCSARMGGDWSSSPIEMPNILASSISFLLIGSPDPRLNPPPQETVS
jgi:hypothetical protein